MTQSVSGKRGGGLSTDKNADKATIRSFGSEWQKFRQDDLPEEELREMFESYFRIFPWVSLPQEAEGFDMGCGSGRWARFVASRVGKLHCVDASIEALEVAERNLCEFSNISFIHATTESVPIGAESCDFGYTLGVLHHIPDTFSALQDCVRLLKPGAPFLLYLYYRLDNRPAWFRVIWTLSDYLRKMISKLPDTWKPCVTDVFAATVYWPLSRLAKCIQAFGFNPEFIPLAGYRNSSFQTLRTDSRDRLGTPLEQRFTRNEIEEMMLRAGLEDIRFSENAPYWCAVGTKAA